MHCCYAVLLTVYLFFCAATVVSAAGAEGVQR